MSLADEDALPVAEAFIPMAAQRPTQTGFFRYSPEPPQESSKSAETPTRRQTAAPKYLLPDRENNLPENEYRSLHNTYNVRMAEEVRIKQKRERSRLAKENAEFFIYGIGIDGVDLGMSGSKIPSPLSMFAGDQLKALLDIDPHTGRKRRYAEDEEPSRRVRARKNDGDQVGRGDDMASRKTSIDGDHQKKVNQKKVKRDARWIRK